MLIQNLFTQFLLIITHFYDLVVCHILTYFFFKNNFLFLKNIQITNN